MGFTPKKPGKPQKPVPPFFNKPLLEQFRESPKRTRIQLPSLEKRQVEKIKRSIELELVKLKFAKTKKDRAIAQTELSRLRDELTRLRRQ